MTNKAHLVRGFLQSNVQKLLALVRPIVEYASVIWSPYTNSNISTLGMAVLFFGNYLTYSSVSNML